jgi:hypothetical protein
VEASERFGTDWPTPGSITGLIAAWFTGRGLAIWQKIYCQLAGVSSRLGIKPLIYC